MLTRFTNTHLTVVTRAALVVFTDQAYQLGAHVKLRLITHSEAVEMLEVKGTYNRLVRDCGPEPAQQIMADVLNFRGTP